MGNKEVENAERESPADDEANAEPNCWNKLDLEFAFVAAGRQNKDHMWKQSPAKRFLITSSIGLGCVSPAR